jgi:hypothetical protein
MPIPNLTRQGFLPPGICDCSLKGAPMITNDEQLNQAVKSLGRMCRAMAALRAEVLPVNARRFALMAEGPVDEIRRLQAQIDAYAGREAAEENDADVWLRLYGRDSEGLCRVHGMSLSRVFRWMLQR